MMTARLFSAAVPVAPTTAAIAPKAPIGATHMIIAMTRKTNRCTCSMPRSTGAPAGPIAWRAKPASRATSRVCSTLPSVRAESMVVGIIPSRKSAVDCAPPAAAWAWPDLASAEVRWRPPPGSSRLPTSRPMPRATVDMARK